MIAFPLPCYRVDSSCREKAEVEVALEVRGTAEMPGEEITCLQAGHGVRDLFTGKQTPDGN